LGGNRLAYGVASPNRGLAEAHKHTLADSQDQVVLGGGPEGHPKSGDEEQQGPGRREKKLVHNDRCAGLDEEDVFLRVMLLHLDVS
jgi:hypothetical protein